MEVHYGLAGFHGDVKGQADVYHQPDQRAVSWFDHVSLTESPLNNSGMIPLERLKYFDVTLSGSA